MTDDTQPIGKFRSTPTLEALELVAFAEGVRVLAEQLEAGLQPDATKDQRTAAEQAALSIVRNAPSAVRIIRRLKGSAEEMIDRAADRRDDIMTALYGPDKT